MKEVFADAFYWIALANPGDQWHTAARNFKVENSLLITSQEVITEFLNFYCAWGDHWRRAVCLMAQDILDAPSILTVPQSDQSFRAGLELYRNRGDKGYSLTDCISMNIMRERGISYVLSRDVHFVQEGFSPIF